MDPDAAEIRVLGALLEKQRTTPDAYPLTLNALRLACNQATNREPVVEYDDATIRAALEHLRRRGWTRMASGAGSRAPKYRHLADEALGLGPAELAVLCVLMLRGPQTLGELRQRTERLHRFEGTAAIEATLTELADRGFAARLDRRPGQKEVRYEQRLGGEPSPSASGDRGYAPPPSAADVHVSPVSVAVEAPPVPAPSTSALDELAERVARLERELAELRAELGA